MRSLFSINPGLPITADPAGEIAQRAFRHYPNSKLDCRGLLLFFSFLLYLGFDACGHSQNKDHAPTITFTQVPTASPGDRDQEDVIVGAVNGSTPEQQIVLYARIGKMWWVQPLADAPITTILPGHVWRNETHLGMEYAALLVNSGFHPAATVAQLPTVGGQVAAIAVAAGGQSDSSVFIDFSGFKWRVRTAPSDRGGTLNIYDPRNVYTDRVGALHLKIANRDGHWTCSELTLTRSLGYGTYSFDVEDTSALEPSAVFGMFTWDYSSKDQNHREFDIEISRWGDPNRRNAQYVVQPYYIGTNVWPFSTPGGNLTHRIVWEPGRITMSTSRKGSAQVLAQHVFAPEVPTPGSESMRMNLYAFSEQQHRTFPPLQHAAEVIVDDFSYLP